jgi:CHAT domain-containing protein/predicted negative regulator of RcsB-dependent stress response
MDWVTAILVGLAVGIGGMWRSHAVHQEREQWRQLPETERAGYEATETAEWLRGAGDPEGARQHLEETLARCRAANDALCAAMIEDALGRHFSDVGQPEKALAHLREARGGAAAGGNRSLEARVLQGTGSCYRDLGDSQKALDLHQQALRLLENGQDLRGEALVQGGLGAVYHDLGKRKEALEAFGRAVELLGADWQRNARRGGFVDGGSTVQGATALVNLGAAHRDVGNLDASLRYFQWGLAAFQRIGHRRGEAVTLLDMGAAYRDSGDKRRALEHYERALPLLFSLRHRAGEAQAAAALARLLGDTAPNRAIFHGKQAVAIYEAVRDDIHGLDPALQQVYAFTVAGTYRRLAGLLAARARIPEAEEVLGLLKRREYFDYIRRDAAEPKDGEVPWTPAEERARGRYVELSERLGAIQRNLVRLRRKQFLATKLRDLPVELPAGPGLNPSEEAQVAALTAEEERALRALREFFGGLDDAVGARSGSPPERPAASEELARALDDLGPGHVGVYTVVEEDAVRMLLVTPTALRAYVSPLDGKGLASAVLAMREALEDPSQDARPAARRVYDAIVGPMAADLDAARAGTIIWFLDGVLRYIPTGALHDGDRWLAERYRSVVFPGGNLASITAAPRRPWTVVGLGVTKAHEGFPPLPGVRDELAAVVHGARGGGVLPGEELLDEAFTAGAFAGALEGRRPVVHVATHFLFRPGDESRSFLLLGDGSHLTVGEVRAMPSSLSGIDQVTLSACESAVQGGDGAEIDGLAVLAQKKGAAAVLASLWPVADVVAPVYMREYYSRREAGLTRADALQAVQLAMIRGALRPEGDPRGAGWEHPFFWAPFTLLGNGR